MWRTCSSLSACSRSGGRRGALRADGTAQKKRPGTALERKKRRLRHRRRLEKQKQRAAALRRRQANEGSEGSVNRELSYCVTLVSPFARRVPSARLPGIVTKQAEFTGLCPRRHDIRIMEGQLRPGARRDCPDSTAVRRREGALDGSIAAREDRESRKTRPSRLASSCSNPGQASIFGAAFPSSTNCVRGKALAHVSICQSPLKRTTAFPWMSSAPYP